jgi:hypothetical protein
MIQERCLIGAPRRAYTVRVLIGRRRRRAWRSLFLPSSLVLASLGCASGCGRTDLANPDIDDGGGSGAGRYGDFGASGRTSSGEAASGRSSAAGSFGASASGQPARDAACTVVDPLDYDRTCAVDSECVVIPGVIVESCNPSPTCPFCSSPWTAVINENAVARYNADLATAQVAGANLACAPCAPPAVLQTCCRSGGCQIGPVCASTMTLPESGPMRAPCLNDRDCRVGGASCGTDVCSYPSMTCTPAGHGPLGLEGWCTVDTDCKCHDEGATCQGSHCTFTTAATDAGK